AVASSAGGTSRPSILAVWGRPAVTWYQSAGDRCGDAVGFSLSTRRRCKGRRQAERTGVTPRIARTIFQGGRMRPTPPTQPTPAICSPFYSSYRVDGLARRSYSNAKHLPGDGRGCKCALRLSCL